MLALVTAAGFFYFDAQWWWWVMFVIAWIISSPWAYGDGKDDECECND